VRNSETADEEQVDFKYF